jgi:hypothetical protein
MALLCGLLVMPVADAGPFQAGAAKRMITPDPLLPLSAGAGPPREVVEKKGDLWVRALVLENSGTRVAVVSVDSLGWPGPLGDRARSRMQDIAPENVMIGATHTHSAPDPYGFPDFKGGHSADLEYLDWVCTQMADAVNEAIASLKPATLTIAMGDVKGKIAYNYYAPQLYDPRAVVWQVAERAGNKPIATLVNYAIHPEILLDKPILGPDLCGPLYERIEEVAGGVAIFMNGAQGGMITADNRGPNGESIETWEECVRIGTALADEALRIVADGERLSNPSIHCTSEMVDFPVTSPLLRGLISKTPHDPEQAKKVLESGMYPARLQLVNVGPAQIVTIPGEALPNIGYYVKRHMPTKYPMLFGLTNDAFGYILTEVDFNSFKRYEYISNTSLGEKTGTTFIEAALKLIEAAPQPETGK